MLYSAVIIWAAAIIFRADREKPRFYTAWTLSGHSQLHVRCVTQPQFQARAAAVQGIEMAPRFVAKQLSRPSGLGGWLIRNLMNRGNAELNAFAVELLGLAPQDRVLEVGFGGRVALKSLLQKAGHVCGIDRSEDAVMAAQKRFGGEVAEGRAEFRSGAVETLPFAVASFDKALSVNTVYFWASLDGGLAEIARVLRGDGRIALGFVPKARMDRMNFPLDIFTPREPEDLTRAMASVGFAEVELRQPGPESGWMVATGVRA